MGGMSEYYMQMQAQAAAAMQMNWWIGSVAVAVLLFAIGVLWWRSPTKFGAAVRATGSLGGRASSRFFRGLIAFAPPQFTVLQIVGAGLLGAYWLSGIAAQHLAGDHVHAVPVLCVALVFGLWLVAKKRWADASLVANLLPMVGLAFTVHGILSAKDAADWLSQGGRIEANKSLISALIANGVGIVGFMWMRLSMRVARGTTE